MKRSARSHWAAIAAMTFLLAACAARDVVTAGAQAESRVTVDWTDPAKFRETRESHGRGLVRGTAWLETLKAHVQRRAARLLPEDRRLAVTFTDIKLAGAFEPWRGPEFDDVRIVKDIYPPRIDLRFVVRAADGSVLGEGERKLSDIGFLTRGMANTSDPMRYEKRMLDEWLEREFGANRAQPGS